MNKQAILAELSSLYPGKPIKMVPADEPTEIICEFDPRDEHPDWSLAVAVIDKSQPHFHRKLTETYHVIRGQLTLHLENDDLVMYEGQHYVITPGLVHWAEGDSTWVEVYCTPGYDAGDHHLTKLPPP